MKCKKCFKGYQDCEHYLDGYCQAPLKKFKNKKDEENEEKVYEKILRRSV